MRKILFILLLFIIFIPAIEAQSNQVDSIKIKFELLPKGLHFIPLRANTDEAKMGVLMYPKNWHLKVDIGNSVDVFKLSFDDNVFTIGAGV